MKASYLGILVIIVVAGLGGYYFLTQKSAQPTSMAVANVRVSITEDAFVPEEITIKKGQQVTWINNTKEFRWPASNLHPTHGIYPEFDPQQPVPPGKTWSFIFDRVGTWRYHDHLKPTVLATVRVIE